MGTEASQIIGDRYLLGRVIGEGGMGVVHRAQDLKLQQEVAIKLAKLGDNPHLLRWFLRGARLARKIVHPNVVRTTDHGRLPDGGAFLVMELVEGLNFDHIFASQLPLPHQTHLLSQVVDALAFVHARGILHRDIKPDNVLVVRDESGSLQVKITDFGLAGIFDQQGASEDSFKPADDHWVMGTPHYMAPERIDGFVPVGPASDLYSVGVMLYRMVSGDLPFPQASLRAMYLKRTSEAPQLYAREELTVPRALIDVTHRLILMDPNLRYRVAADVLADLKPHQRALSLSPDEWIALAPTTLNLTFSSDETLAHLHRASLDDVDLTVALTENPALWGRNQLRAALESLAEKAESGAGQVGVMLSVPGAGGAEMLQTFSTASAQAGRFTVLSGTFQEVAGRPSGLRQALEEHLRSAELDAFRLRSLLWRQRRQLGLSDETELEALLRFLRPHGGDAVPPDNQQNRLFALFVRVLRALAEERPVMLSLEGLGEGGELSAAFIEFISFELSFDPFPLFVLGSSGLLNSHQDFARRFTRTDRYEGSVRHCLDLAPLDGPILAEHLARSFGLAPESALQLAGEAGGLPMLAAELAELTAARMTDTDVSDRSTTLELRPVTPLSASLIGLLLRTVHERLDKHHDAEALEALLLGVAVLGDEVSLDLLERLLANQLSPEQFDDHVDTLMGLKLLQDRGDIGQRRVRLQPSVLRRALLEQEGGDHRGLHRSAAEVRRSLSGDQALSEAGAIGDHLEAAGDVADACDHWLQAADFETQHGDALLGAEWGLKALATLDSENPQRSPLAIRLGRTLLDAGSAERAEKVLAEVVANGSADEALFAGEVLADLHENHGASLAWKGLIETLETREMEASPAGRRAFLRTRSMWLNSYGRSQEARDDAEEALREAEPGQETQRAAQRLVYCCLSAGRLEEAELAARTALEHSSEKADLRVRSLRALGVVLSWRGRPEEGSQAQNEALDLCRSRGLIARTPIAFHDLGDAWRLSGKLDEADQAYEQAIRTGAELELNHTVELSRVKRIMCRLRRGETEGVVDELRELAPRAVEVGLGLAVPFCALLEAWALSLLNDTRGTLAALERVGELPAVAVDPEVASILRRIAALLCENQDSRARGEALAEFADLLGEPEPDQRPDMPPTE